MAPDLECGGRARSGATAQRMLTEILVIAQQLGCAQGWNIDALLSVADATLDPEAEASPRDRDGGGAHPDA